MLLRFGIETVGYLFRLHRGLDIPERRVTEYSFLRNALQIECFLFGQSGIISTCIGFLKKYATEYIGDKIRTLSGRVAVIVIVKRDAWIFRADTLPGDADGGTPGIQLCSHLQITFSQSLLHFGIRVDVVSPGHVEDGFSFRIVEAAQAVEGMGGLVHILPYPFLFAGRRFTLVLQDDEIPASFTNGIQGFRVGGMYLQCPAAVFH